MSRKRIAIYAAVAVCGLDLLLLISGFRVLITEKRVSDVIVPGGITLGSYDPPVTDIYLACTYFTGRSVKTVRAPDNLDQCPFVYRPRF